MKDAASPPARAALTKPPKILIFAKAPQPGLVKTRLISALGAEGAADLAAQMLDFCLAGALASGLPVELCMSPGPHSTAWDRVDIHESISCSDQGGGDLGERMARAAMRVLAEGQAVILIGSDCAEMDARILRAAAAALEDHDAVIHETADGGYALLGMRAFAPQLFSNMPWSTEDVALETTKRMAAMGWDFVQGEVLHDIHREDDLQYWQPATL